MTSAPRTHAARNFALALLGGVAFHLLASGVGPTPAQAQAYPSQLVRIVVPFTPGSQTDILGRAYADKLQEMWKRDVIVENKPGLAGTASTAKAPPDGYTLLLSSNGHAMIESLNSNLTFDPVKDFVGVAKLAIVPGILVVQPESGPKSLKEMIDLAKAKPGALNYASAGLGSASSIGVELVKAQTGINLVHVPYRGLPEAHTSVIRGDAVVFMTFFSAGGDLIEGKRLRPIGVTTARRLAVLPDVPTLQEGGVAGYAYDPWFGLMAPAGTPKPIIDRIASEVRSIFADRGLRDKLAVQDMVAVEGSDPASFTARVVAETQMRREVVAKQGLKLE
jgi:tripartite-type tricarboxylate transporter receptor subunit TctC